MPGFCPLGASGHPRRCLDITLGPKSSNNRLSAISLSMPGQLGTLGKDNRQALCGKSTLIVTSPGPGDFGKVRTVYKEHHAPLMTQSHLPGYSWLAVCFSSLVSAEATLPGQLVTFAVHIVPHQPTLSWRRIRALCPQLLTSLSPSALGRCVAGRMWRTCPCHPCSQRVCLAPNPLTAHHAVRAPRTVRHSLLSARIVSRLSQCQGRSCGAVLRSPREAGETPSLPQKSPKA